LDVQRNAGGTDYVNVIVLVAGVGNRIREVTHGPKCLLIVGGKSLLHRYLDALTPYASRIENFVLVMGHEAQAIERHAAEHPLGGLLRWVYNPSYEQGSVLSALAAQDYFQQDVLLMDGDVFFTPPLLERLMAAVQRNVLLVDTTSSNTGEEVMAGANHGRVTAIARGMSGSFDIYGEWTGFLRMGPEASSKFRDLLAQFVKNGPESVGYEDVLQQLVDEERFDIVLADGLPWIEIDFPQDLARAERLASAKLAE
jgi:choline kinase